MNNILKYLNESYQIIYNKINQNENRIMIIIEIFFNIFEEIEEKINEILYFIIQQIIYSIEIKEYFNYLEKSLKKIITIIIIRIYI